MGRTKLYAVERLVKNTNGGYTSKFLVYKPIHNPQGSTWTTNIAKASRWQNRADAVAYRDEVVNDYRIKEATLIKEV